MGDWRKKAVRAIEKHLRCYKSYKAGIRNLQKQLDYMMPSLTAKYDLAGGSRGTFVADSSTEKCAIDRIESVEAVELRNQIARYQLIVESIDEALKVLTEVERQFVEYRYFEQRSIRETAEAMGYSEKNIFTIRNQTMGKLIICLRNIIDMREVDLHGIGGS